MQDNQPIPGKEGSECSNEGDKCTDKEHCCGTSYPVENLDGDTDGQLENICVSTVDLKYTDTLGRDYRHVCGAYSLIASVFAFSCFASLLM